MSNVLKEVEARVSEAPDRLLYAFLDGDGNEVQRLTREAFYERVVAISSELCLEHGFKAGDRVLLAYAPGLEMICAFFACVRAGIIPVPVAAPTAQGLHSALFRAEFAAKDCSAAAVLTDTSIREITQIYLTRAGAGQPEVTYIAGLRWLATDTFATRSGGQRISSRQAELLFLQYTSGSTNTPKGVMVSHDNILANSRLVVDHGGAVGVSWLPQHHDMGLIGYLINAALVGGTLYSFSPATFIRRPSLWLEAITKYRATATSAPNFAFEYCLDRGRLSQAKLAALDLSSLQFLMAAAEPVKPAVYERFLRTFSAYGLKPSSFVVAYGLAENTLAVSSYGRDRLSIDRRALSRNRVKTTRQVSEVGAATHLMSCGRPLGDTEVLIVDPERRCELGGGQIGEIWVRGASKCLGYWNNPASTAEIFQARLASAQGGRAVDAEYLRTGDMGFIHQGEVYVCGRRKDTIIVRGQNYYAHDIEAVVERASDAVRSGGVAAFEMDGPSENAVAVVAEQASVSAVPDALAILENIRRYLGLTVDRLCFVAPKAVPKTTSGKIMRYMARQMLIDGRLKVLQEYRPRSAQEQCGDQDSHDGPFASLWRRYKFRGDETLTLPEAGLDSIELVEVLHEVMDILIAHGAGELAEKIDFRLVQDLSIAELYRLTRRFETAPEVAIAQIRLMLTASNETERRRDRDSMIADSRPAAKAPVVNGPLSADGPSAVLLTGCTGFLGPFMLRSLLEQTEGTVFALVRAATPNEGRYRLRAGLKRTGWTEQVVDRELERRVVPVLGDLALPGLGLDAQMQTKLAGSVDTIFHNGAMVNYLYTYARMRAPNVLGTREIVRLACEGRPKVLNYVSTTFIFGWATKDILTEDDSNADMELLDFGYSQTKWAAEQIVLDAMRQGLTARVFRPALITPSMQGGGGAPDITLRILAFMIKHGISVDTANQVSFVPADVVAHNIVAISRAPWTADRIFHMTRDDYANMPDVMEIITELTGRRFDFFDLKSFVPEVIRRCTRDDPLYPLLNFLIGSIDNISSMEFKRYQNQGYRAVRDALSTCRSDPPLSDTVMGILQFMKLNGFPELSMARTLGPAAMAMSRGSKMRGHASRRGAG
jgi:thioester reductase-like protein